MPAEGRMRVELETQKLASRDEVETSHRTLVRVEQGVLSFQIRVARNGDSGRRRFLWNGRPGDVFADLEPAAGSNVAVLMVADQDSTITRLPSAVLSANTAATWLNRLAAALGIEVPSRCTRVEPSPDGASSSIDLAAGAHAQGPAFGAVLLEIRDGTLTFAGYPELTLTPDSGRLLLTGDLFVTGSSAATVLANPANLPVDPELWDVLERTQNLILRSFELSVQRTEEEQKKRTLERTRLNERVNAEALQDLTQLTAEKAEAAFSREGSAHLVAMRALMAPLGQSIEPGLPGGDNELLAIVERSGLRMRRVLLRDQWWLQDNGPLIGYRGEGRTPVALVPADGSHYRIFDPERNQCAVVNREIADDIDVVAFLIYRSFPDQIRTFWDALRFGLVSHGKDVKVVAFAALASAFLDLVVPVATGLFVDYVIPYGDRPLLWQLAGLLSVAALGSFALQIVQAATLTRMQSGFTHICQSAFWDKLLRLSPGFFRGVAVGELFQQALTVLLIDLRLQTWTVQSFTAGLSIFVLLIAIAIYSPALAAIHAGAGVLLILAASVSASRISDLARVAEKLAGELAGASVQIIGGMTKLRVAGAEFRALSVWGRAFTRQQRQERWIQRTEDAFRVISAFMPVLATTATLWYAAEVQHAGQPGATIGLGSMVAVLAASAVWFRALGEITQRSTDLALITNQWRFGRNILVTAPEISAFKTHPGNLTGRLAVQRVSFRYKADGPLILDNVSMEIEAGSCVAIVGPSGSGKSTLVNLLLGFETPDSGSILYDGQDLAGIDLRAIRAQVGIVMQETRLMSGSIWEQITGGSGATLEEAWEAARGAGIADEIQGMPMGMHTVISEGGTNISGGQRQRLLIARALVLKPKILIFDEATSALDNRTQAIVTESLRKLSITRILIAHRLSTIRHADRIYVMKRGQVVEQGTYEDLLARGEVFANLVSRQKL